MSGDDNGIEVDYGFMEGGGGIDGDSKLINVPNEYQGTVAEFKGFNYACSSSEIKKAYEASCTQDPFK